MTFFSQLDYVFFISSSYIHNLLRYHITLKAKCAISKFMKMSFRQTHTYGEIGGVLRALMSIANNIYVCHTFNTFNANRAL